MANVTYVIVYPERFANRFTIYAASTDRSEELHRYAESQCPATGYVTELDPESAAELLWGVPARVRLDR